MVAGSLVADLSEEQREHFFRVHHELSTAGCRFVDIFMPRRHGKSRLATELATSLQAGFPGLAVSCMSWSSSWADHSASDLVIMDDIFCAVDDGIGPGITMDHIHSAADAGMRIVFIHS